MAKIKKVMHNGDAYSVGGTGTVSIKQGGSSCGSFCLDQDNNTTINLQRGFGLNEITRTSSGGYSLYTIGNTSNPVLYSYNYSGDCIQTFILNLPSYSANARHRLNIYAGSASFCYNGGSLYFNDSGCSKLFVIK